MAKKLKTMDIKRKNKKGEEVKVGEYVTVVERVKGFHELYPKGKIVTELIKFEESSTIVAGKEVDTSFAIINAVVYPDFSNLDRSFNGHAHERADNGYINKHDFIENCETSAVGRALGLLGIGSDKSIATTEDIEQAMNAYSKISMPEPKKEVVEQAQGKAEAVLPKAKTEEVVKKEETPKEEEIVPSGVVPREKAKAMYDYALSQGYLKPEIIEIIGSLGYKKIIEVLEQDHETIMKQFKMLAIEYREVKKEWEDA